MVLAKLAVGIAERLEKFGNGWVFRLKPHRRTGHSDFGQASAERVLAGDKCRASCGATLLAVIVSESAPFIRNTVDIRGSIAHHAATEIADIPCADVITPENQDIRLFCSHDLFLPSC